MESIADAVHQSTAPAFVLAAIGATLNALIARNLRVFKQMREISLIEGDQELLNQAMALMLLSTGCWVTPQGSPLARRLPCVRW